MESAGTPFTVLERFWLKEAEGTGKELNKGTYGVDLAELSYRGLKCAGRKVPRWKGGDWLHRVEAECSLLSELRHPNIVQFIGVHLDRGGHSTPVLVMEYLSSTLAGCLERFGVLPEEISYAVLRDVALGLAFLHGRSPPILHGCLTAYNVHLTTDMTAKLADVGVAMILSPPAPADQSSMTPSTSEPIRRVYLPPESVGTKPQLNTRSDSYSFGVLMIHTVTANLPSHVTSIAMNGTDAGSSSNGLDESLGEISYDHPLASIILQCLNSYPKLRPSAAQIFTLMTKATEQYPTPTVGSRLEALLKLRARSQSQALSSKKDRRGLSIRRRDSTSKNLANAIEIEQLRLEVDELLVENRGLKATLSKQRNVMTAHDQEMAAKLMAKDQEIVSKYLELSARDTTVDACKATIAAKEATIQGLTAQLKRVQGHLATKNEPHLLSPKAQLKWSQCAYVPTGMVFAQAVAVGDTVYYGSGTSTIGDASAHECPQKIFKYQMVRDKWVPVPGCPVAGFGMVEYMGKLTVVGGAYESEDGAITLTGDVHTLEEGREWKKSIPSMATTRLLPTLMSFESFIVACGGFVIVDTQDICVSEVEIFNQEDLKWYRAEPLPMACIGMSATVVQDSCYLLGGFTDTDFDHPTEQVFTASLSVLVDTAVGKQSKLNGSLGPPTQHIWQAFQEAPRYASTAATLGGCLLTLGGTDERLEHKSGALHVYSPLTDSWVRIEDIPVECFSCAVAKLLNGDIMVIGGMGHDEEDALRTVYRGEITLD